MAGRGQGQGVLFNPVVLAEIVLPTSTSNNVVSYKFTYNVYGEIDKVVYPTGGYERLEYGAVRRAATVEGGRVTRVSVYDAAGDFADVGGYSQSTNPRQKYAGMEGNDSTGMGHTSWRESDSLSARWTQGRLQPPEQSAEAPHAP